MPKTDCSTNNLNPEDLAAYQALVESHFVPFFQPQVALRTGELSGFEILARWKHPIRGLISPIHFIHQAEQEGWIGALSKQILTKAVAAASAIPAHLTLAINISPYQLRDVDLPKQLHDLAQDSDFPLSRLIIEITESALIENLQSARSIVGELKSMGCKLALDDFGTGYSSLHHLQSLPFDQIKVDRSFVSSMVEQRDSRKIVAAVVGLGQSLGMTTIAEGIEKVEQAEMLLWLGCDQGQGYFYNRPMPGERLSQAISEPLKPVRTDGMSAWKKQLACSFDISPLQRFAQLRAIYDGAPVGLAFVDQHFRYVNVNERLAEMNGVPLEKHLGCKVSDVVPEIFSVVEPYLSRALKGEALSDIEVTLPISGDTRLLSYQPAFDEAGEILGVAIAATDITERKDMENALRASEAHYKKMLDLNPEVLWIMDPTGWNLDLTPRWDKTTGRMTTKSLENRWLTYIHPDDLRATVKAIAISRRTGTPIDVTYRLANDEGGWTWKHSLGAPRFDRSGNLVCWYGSIQDVDEPGGSAVSLEKDAPSGTIDDTTPEYAKSKFALRNKALLDLELLDTPSEVEFDDLVDLASEICATPISLISLVDLERQWFKASVGMTVCETPISSSFCAHAIEQEGLFLVEDATVDERFKLNPLVLGEPNIRFYAGMPLYSGEGVAIGTLCVIDTVPRSLSPNQIKALTILSHQVQARIELRANRRKLLSALSANRELTVELQHNNQILAYANSQLEQLANVDPLTGVLNRRAFEDLIDTEFTTAQRDQSPLSLLIMDIDDFKKRNDVFGHAAGDEALRHVGALLRKTLRAGDSVARIGGEEFAILLPQTSVDDAILIAQRVQDMLEQSLGVETSPPITLSIGIACLDAPMTGWDSLLAEADRAMYEAKRQGKNRFVVHEPSMVGPSFKENDSRSELHHVN